MENYNTDFVALDNIIVDFLSKRKSGGYCDVNNKEKKIREDYNTYFTPNEIYDRCKELAKTEILKEEYLSYPVDPSKNNRSIFMVNPKRKEVKKDMNENQYKTLDTFHDRLYIPHVRKTVKAWKLDVDMYETIPKYSYKAFTKLNGEIKEKSNAYDWDGYVPFIAGHRVRLGYFAWRRALHNLVKRSIKESRKYREEQMFNERLAIAKDYERTE